jgi:hypothetical protein
MSGHTEIEIQLVIYRDLKTAEQRLVDAHVGSCSACAARQAMYAEIDGLIASLTDPRPSARLSQRLDAILRGERPTRRAPASLFGWAPSWRPPRPMRVFVPIGLALLLILSVWLVAQITTPVRHQIAETPSVTPTATPLALASPQFGVGLTVSGRPDGYATSWRPQLRLVSTSHAAAAYPVVASTTLAAARLTPAAVAVVDATTASTTAQGAP